MRIRLLALAAVMTLPGGAPAQPIPAITCDGVAEFPCSFQIGRLRLQKAPALLKLQARVSQARLPIGEGIFNTLWVKLLRGTDLLCLEQFENVHVRESVLNLEIGHGMSCEMDAVIAENTGLAFQICLGGLENCLRPIELAATPYAIKASYASLAQSAHEANLAGQAHYAHRATADREMFIRNQLGTGYIDFATQPSVRPRQLYEVEVPGALRDGGYIQWTPVRNRAANNLHIAGKDHDADALRELDALVLLSEETYATGDLTVDPSPGGDGLRVTRRGAHVVGNSDVDGRLRITGNTTVEQEGIDVLRGGLRIGGGGLDVTGNARLVDELRFPSIAPLVSFIPRGDHLFVRGDVRFETQPALSAEQFLAAVEYPFVRIAGEQRPIVPEGRLRIVRPQAQPGSPILALQDAVNTLRLYADGIEATGELFLQRPNAGTTVEGRLAVAGPLEARGQVTAAGNLTVTGQLEARSHVTAAGNLTVNGRLNVNGGAVVNGGVRSEHGLVSWRQPNGDWTLEVHQEENGGQNEYHVHAKAELVEIHDTNALKARGRIALVPLEDACEHHWWDDDRAGDGNGAQHYNIECGPGLMLTQIEVSNVFAEDEGNDADGNRIRWDRDGDRNADNNRNNGGNRIGGIVRRFKCCPMLYILRP